MMTQDSQEQKTSNQAQPSAAPAQSVETPPASGQAATSPPQPDAIPAASDQEQSPTDKSRIASQSDATPDSTGKPEADQPAQSVAETHTEATTATEAAESPPPAALPLKSNLAVVIDDEPANRDFLERLVHQADYETIGASSGKEALEITEQLPHSPALIAVDSELPDMKGLDLVKIFRQRFPQSKIVMATMHDDRNTISEAFTNGCDVFLVKPHGFMELFKRLKMLPSDPSVLDNLIFDSHGVRTRR